MLACYRALLESQPDLRVRFFDSCARGAAADFRLCVCRVDGNRYHSGLGFSLLTLDWNQIAFIGSPCVLVFLRVFIDAGSVWDADVPFFR